MTLLRTRLGHRWAAVLTGVSLLFTGCGGDSASTSETASAESSCVESFTSTAPDTLPRLARLSHDLDSQLTVGDYSGKTFTAEIYDELLSGDGVDVTVEPGACVITEVSKDWGPLYLFVEAEDGSWHRLLESDPNVPLVPDPESLLENTQHVEIEDIGA